MKKGLSGRKLGRNRLENISITLHNLLSRLVWCMEAFHYKLKINWAVNYSNSLYKMINKYPSISLRDYPARPWL